MNKEIVLFAGGIGLVMAKAATAVLQWAERNMEDSMATERGPKEQAALDSLDRAIEDVKAWRADDDESDASAIAAREAELRKILPRPTQGQATDALTGLPVDASQPQAPGPVSPVTSDPVVTPEEAGTANEAPEGTATLSEDDEAEAERRERF